MLEKKPSLNNILKWLPLSAIFTLTIMSLLRKTPFFKRTPSLGETISFKILHIENDLTILGKDYFSIKYSEKRLADAKGS